MIFGIKLKKKMLNTKFHSKHAYGEKYLKAKVRTFNGVLNTIFCSDKIPKDYVHYTCIAAVSIDSVIKVDKKDYSQVHLEEFNYEIRKEKNS